MTITILAGITAALLALLGAAFLAAWPLPASLALPAGLGVLGLVGVGILWWVFVLRPLLALKKSMARLETGAGSARVSERGSRELKDLAASYNFLADRLDDRRREQLRFISNVVHDLRNPLHSITMASELLELKSPENNGELVKAIFRQVSGLDVLLSDLIDLSRIEAGELDLKVCEQDIMSLVHEAVECYRKGNDLHHFRVEVQEESIVCRCDPRRMTHVLRSLLSNAVQYSPRGGEVRIRVRRAGERVEISVTDHGMGIAREEHGNIFKPFYRLKPPGTSIPGKGLGLSTSRRIVEAHGGQIRVDSQPGHGSTFRLWIPAAGPPGGVNEIAGEENRSSMIDK